MGPDRVGSDEPLTPAERQFLLDAGEPADSFDPGRQEAARASLRRRAEETRRKAAPEFTADQVAGLLGCTEAQVLSWANDQELYSFVTDEGLRFPEWQFPDGKRLPGLRLVLRELGRDTHPYSVEGLLAVVPHEELDDMTAVAWLAGGGSIESVVSLAVSSSYDM
jgi:hypothetical protein